MSSVYNQLKPFLNYFVKTYLTPSKERGKYVCPFCQSGNGPNGSGAFSVLSKEGKFLYKCFSCDNKGDIIDLAQQVLGLSKDEAKEELCRLYNIAYTAKPIEKSYTAPRHAPAHPDASPVQSSNSRSLSGNIDSDKGELSSIGNIDSDKDDLADRDELSYIAISSLSNNDSEFLHNAQNALKEIDGKGNEYAKTIPAVEFLTDRFISPETAKSVGLGFAHYENGKYSACEPYDTLVIPLDNGSIIYRNCTAEGKKDRYRKQAGAKANTLTLIEDAGGDSPIYFTEGELDAVTLYQEGVNAVSLGGVSNISIGVEWVRKNLGGIIDNDRLLVLYLDPDEPGQKAAKELKKALLELNNKLKIAVVTPEVIRQATADLNTPEGAKLDANEVRRCTPEGADKGLRELFRLVSRYGTGLEHLKKLEACTGKFILDTLLRDIEAGKYTKCIKSGFSALDEALDGGFRPGLTVLGGGTSQGKTALAMQLADNIACNGTPVFYFSIEMAPHELIARDLVRLTHEMGKREIGLAKLLDGKERPDPAVLERYKKEIIPNLYLRKELFTTDKICNYVLDFVAYIDKRPPVVIVDYLQLLQHDNNYLSERQKADDNIFKLKTLGDDLNTPVICLSAFNRQSYKLKPSLEAFKESGGIEYGADLVLGLGFKGQGEEEFDYDQASEKEIRELTLQVLKNRRGKRSQLIGLEFIGRSYYFREVEYKSGSPVQSSNSRSLFGNIDSDKDNSFLGFY